MIYPKTDDYAVLYARYFQRRPEELLALAGNIEGKKVIDICGGNGRASKAAIKIGAKEVVLVDRSLNMIPHNLDPKIRVESTEVHNAFLTLASFDVAICQQAVNYWLDTYTVNLLCNSLAPNGIFIFNTFHNKPTKKPMIKEYEFEGRNYAEISWLTEIPIWKSTEELSQQTKPVVHHVQVGEGLEPHTTQFAWIEPDEFDRILTPYFNIEVTKTGLGNCFDKSTEICDNLR